MNFCTDLFKFGDKVNCTPLCQLLPDWRSKSNQASKSWWQFTYGGWDTMKNRHLKKPLQYISSCRKISKSENCVLTLQVYFFDWIIYYTCFIQLLPHVCIISCLVYKIWCIVQYIVSDPWWGPEVLLQHEYQSCENKFIIIQSSPFNRFLLQRTGLSLEASSEEIFALIRTARSLSTTLQWIKVP